MRVACLYLLLLFICVLMDMACVSDLFDDYNYRFDSDERLDASGRRIHFHPYERYMYGIFPSLELYTPVMGRPVTLCCCGAMVPPRLVGLIMWDSVTSQCW